MAVVKKRKDLTIISKPYNYWGNQGLVQYSNLSDISELQGLTGVKNLLRYFYIDSQAQGLVRGLVNIILKDVPVVVDVENEEQKDFLQAQVQVIHKSFEQWLMWYLFIGFAVGEKLYEIQGGKLISKGLNVLHPTTVYQILDDKIVQYIWGYNGGKFEIPREKVIYEMFIAEDIPWGKGLGRACYRDLKLKDFYYKIAAIGWENTAIGIPVVKIDPSISDEDKSSIETQLENLRGGEGAYMIFTKDLVDFEFAENTGFRGKTSELLNLIKHHDEQIARAMLMQFINLTATGSRALAESMIDFFLASTEKIRKLVYNYIEKMLQEISLQNFGYEVKVKYPDLIQKDPNEIVKTIATAMQAGAIGPDLETENYIRKLLQLPERDLKSVPTQQPQEKKQIEHTPEHIYTEEEGEDIWKLSRNGDIFNRKLKDYENEEILRLTEKSYSGIEDRIMELVKKYGNKYTNEILAKIREIKEKQGGKITDMKKLLKNYFQNDPEFMAELKEIFKDGVNQGVNVANAEMGTQLEFKSLTKEVQQKIAEKAMVTATSLDQNLKSSLVYNLLVDNIYTQDIKAIHEHLLNSVAKAAKMNVTQVSGLFINAGKDLVFKEINKEQLKKGGNGLLVVRSAVLDKRTCSTCAALDGMVFGIGDPNADKYVPPAQCEGGHACRCTILAYQEGGK